MMEWRALSQNQRDLNTVDNCDGSADGVEQRPSSRVPRRRNLQQQRNDGELAKGCAIDSDRESHPGQLQDDPEVIEPDVLEIVPEAVQACDDQAYLGSQSAKLMEVSHIQQQPKCILTVAMQTRTKSQRMRPSWTRAWKPRSTTRMVPMIASVQVMPNSSGPAPPYAGIMMKCEQLNAEEVDNEEKKRTKQLYTICSL